MPKNNGIISIGKTAESLSVTLDVNELIYSKGLILASSGFGKSMLLRLLIELAAPVVQTVVIDPDGEFPSLREKLDILIVGGDNADIKLDIPSAALLARKLAETGVSAVINLYEVPGPGDPWDKRRQWYANFMNGYMNLPKELWSFVFMPIDEAHQFAPEGKGDEHAAAARSATRLAMSQGRKHGLGLLPATQRISKIDKDSISDARNTWIGGANLDLDIDRAADMLGIKKSGSNVLREMNPGEFFCYGPAFQTRGVSRFVADKPKTTHPKAGKRLEVKVPKASSKIHEIAALFGDLPQTAHDEAVTLESLMRDKLRLEREKEDLIQKQKNLVPAAAAIIPAPEIITIAVPIFDDAHLAQLRKTIEDMNMLSETLGTNVKYVQESVDKAKEISNKKEFNFNPEDWKPLQPTAHRDSVIQVTKKVKPRSHVFSGIAAAITPGEERPSKLPDGNLTILRYAGMHPEGLRRDQLTVLSGYKKDTRNKYIRELMNWDYLVENELIMITAAGAAAIGEYLELPERAELRRRWLSELPKGEKEILAVIMDTYPESVSRNRLTELTGYLKDTRNKYIRNLERFFLIEDLPSSMVRASKYLFT